MDKSLALNYVNYFAGINYGLAMYSVIVPEPVSLLPESFTLTMVLLLKLIHREISLDIQGIRIAFSVIWSRAPILSYSRDKF
jgi:hypothetical protein